MLNDLISYPCPVDPPLLFLLQLLCLVDSSLLEEKEIIDNIRMDPLLGRRIADRFTKEGRIGWKTMKTRYTSKKFTDPVGNDVYKNMLNDVYSRVTRAAALVPSAAQYQNAIDGLKARSEASKQGMRDTARTKPLLCAVFLSSNDLETLKENLNNSRRADAWCDWSVTFFGGEDTVISKFLNETKSGTYSNVIHAANYTGPRAASGTNYVPKPVFYASLLPMTSAYKRIWILDADISVRAFSFAKLFRVLDCSIMYQDDTHPLSEMLRRPGFPRGPLVSQPVVADNTQFFPSLNAAYWAKAGLGRRASHLAQLVRFTEQQMPIFQSDFFEWYVMYVIKPWVPVSLILEATWGFDTTWCGAAEDYALFHSGETALGNAYYAKYNVSRPSACAILLGTTPVRHMPKTGSQMATKHGNAINYATFYFTGHMQKYWVHDRFPEWYVPQKRALPKANWGNLVLKNQTDGACIAARSARYFADKPLRSRDMDKDGKRKVTNTVGGGGGGGGAGAASVNTGAGAGSGAGSGAGAKSQVLPKPSGGSGRKTARRGKGLGKAGAEEAASAGARPLVRD